MNKFYMLLMGMIFSSSLFSQIFSDDFESYSSGDLIAESSDDWTTWTDSPGGTEDTAVSDVQANQGANSLYFMSDDASGGPTDIYLPFGGTHTNGIFNLELYIYVDENYGAYFNLQGEEDPGNEWAVDVFLLQDGTLSVFSDNAGTEQLTSTYLLNTWIKINIDVDLSDNIWEVSIDDVSLGTFSNAVNSLGGLNIFPWNGMDQGGNGESSFYVDDVSYEYSAATSIESLIVLNQGLLVYPNPAEDVVNLSLSDINSSKTVIEIIDITGKLVEQTIISSLDSDVLQLNVNNYESGIYIIQVRNNNTIYKTKLTIK